MNGHAEIALHCEGEGEPIYLIGGGPAFTTWNLQPVQSFLSRDYKVCRWDMRGVGDNKKLAFVPGQTVLSSWLDDMHAVLNNKPAILWGHSWGALQILLYARQYPDHVNALILSNPTDPALLSLNDIEHKLYAHDSPASNLTLNQVGTAAEKQYYFHSKIASYFRNADQGWEYALQFSEDDSNNMLNVRVWDEYRSEVITDRDMQALEPKIAGIIHCQHDVLQPESHQEYQRLVSDHKHHVLGKCAHFPWVENPDDYYRLLHQLVSKSASMLDNQN
jgi:pimeloyl-ACP methyl ester carboxylesterase